MRVPVLLACLLAALASPAAHADGGEVISTFSHVPVQVGENHVVAVECYATASPGSSFDVPLTTSVVCTVNGVEHRGVGAGPEAATAFVVISDASFEICLSAAATFYDVSVHETYDVTDDGWCATVPL